ncbi:MAG: glycosyltransferase family 9 protein [Candidatus Kapaibacteriales bacterium]
MTDGSIDMSGIEESNKNMRKNVVVYSTAFIGDVFISLRLVAALINSGEYNVHIVTTPLFSQICPSIDGLTSYHIYNKRDKGKAEEEQDLLFQYLNKLKIDIYITLHPSLRASLIARKSGAKRKLCYKNSSGRFLYRNESIEYLKGVHEHQRLRLFYNKVSNSIWDDRIEFRFPQEIIDNYNKHKGKYLVFPGSAWETKKLPVRTYAEVIKSIGFEKVLILGGPGEEDLCSELTSMTKSLNLAGKVSLLESVYLVSIAKKVICNDSAPTHIANLVKTPVTTIFGPTSPIFGFYPDGEKDNIFYKAPSCSPCDIHGQNKCPLGHHKCMELIDAGDILKTLQ